MTPEQEQWDYESAKEGWKICGARVVVYMTRMREAERLLAERKESICGAEYQPVGKVSGALFLSQEDHTERW